MPPITLIHACLEGYLEEKISMKMFQLFSKLLHFINQI